MPNKKINILKGNVAEPKTPSQSHIDSMQNDLQAFMKLLTNKNNLFDVKDAYSSISKYSSNHDRVLYSVISDFIFEIVKNDPDDKKGTMGSIDSNMEALLSYATTASNDITSNNSTIKGKSDSHKKTYETVLKIWDHINLARKQFTSLYQTDEEYNNKFQPRIDAFQNKIMSEMTSHLLTLVGIFTALAFLIFGSITSLENVLSNLKETSVLKVMLSGCIWGLCILNLLFVFLFCVRKISNIDQSSNTSESVFHQYSIVVWANGIIIVLMLVLGWSYILHSNGIDDFIFRYFNRHPIGTFWAGTGLVLLVAIILFTIIVKATKGSNNKKGTSGKKNACFPIQFLKKNRNRKK